MWTIDQITVALGAEKAPPICRYFGVEEGGNFENGTSVLHTPLSEETVARLFKMPVEEFMALREEADNLLFHERERRARPGRDDKILTSWNGLMISALAKGYQVFRKEKYRALAEGAAAFLLEDDMDGTRVFRSWKDGKTSGFGFLEDYAFLAEGLLDLYQATFVPRWLRAAVLLVESMIQQFWDADQAGFFFTGPDQRDILVRTKDAYDQAVPSGNSVAASNLLRLGRLTGNADYVKKAEATLQLYSGAMAQSPTAFPNMLATLDLFLTPSLEIVVTGDDDAKDLESILTTIHHAFLPNASLAYHSVQSDDDSLKELIPLLREKRTTDGQATVYLCQGQTCEPPITSLAQLKKRLQDLSPM